MKKFIYIMLFAISLLSYATNVYSIENASFLDSLIVVKNDYSIQYKTNAYVKANKLYNEQENRWEISESFGGVELAPESKLKIEQDGGILNVFRNCLSEDNFQKLDEKIRFPVRIVMNQDGVIYGISIEIHNKLIKDIHLTDDEVLNLLNYVYDLHFIYLGTHIRENFLVNFLYPFNFRK